MSEKTVQTRIMLAISKLGSKIFRNNVGMLEDKYGNKIRYGLCNGSSDLIGWTPITISEDMVGSQVAVFTAIEVKRGRKDKAKPHQLKFIEAVNRDGGIAGVAYSDETAIEIIKDVAFCSKRD